MPGPLEPGIKDLAVTLYLQGVPQHAVASRLGVSEGWVSELLSGMRKLWEEHAARDRMKLIAEGLAKLDLVECAAWERRDLGTLVKCLNIRFKVLGAYTTNVTVSVRPTLPWDEILAAHEAANVTVEQKYLPSPIPIHGSMVTKVESGATR